MADQTVYLRMRAILRVPPDLEPRLVAENLALELPESVELLDFEITNCDVEDPK